MKILIKMIRGFGYETPSGIQFSKQHPYNIVEDSEIEFLDGERFIEATKEEVIAFYGKDAIIGFKEDS